MKKLRDLMIETLILIEGSDFVMEVGELTLSDIEDLKERDLDVYIAKEKKLTIDKDDFINELIERVSYLFEDYTYDDFEENLLNNAQSDEQFQKATVTFLKEFERIFPTVFSASERVEVE